MTKLALILKAYSELIAHDLYTARHGFASLHMRVKLFPLRGVSSGSDLTEAIAVAVDIACCFYPKQVLCLKRSAVLVKLLREKGIPARMVIGAQKLPFKAHAWVDVDGQIIHDRLASRETFFVLEIC
jgi:hypothetical protein